MKYNIIASGSQGNATILDATVLIDCGVPFSALSPYCQELKLVLLTHEHKDHFNSTTIKKLAVERPALRWACCTWLAEKVAAAGVAKKQIDVLYCDSTYEYGLVRVRPEKLTHNVPNCCWHIFFPSGEKVLYATDTNNLNGIFAPAYNLYLIEANYEDEEIQERIREKKESGMFAYELEVIKNHLSKAKCDNFFKENGCAASELTYMHVHKE